MARQQRRRALLWLAGSAVALVLLLLFVAPVVFISAAPLNSWRTEMDIASGRTRSTRYLLGLRFSSESETPGSKLYRELVGEPGLPIWRTVYFTSPGFRSHPAHHCSLVAFDSLVEAVDRPEVTPQAKKEAILTLLRLLRQDDCYFRGMRYSFAVCNVAAEWKAGDAPIGPEKLPAFPPPD